MTTLTTIADFERKMEATQIKNDAADALAGPAFERLLHLAETRDSGQIRRVAAFLAACYNSSAYQLDISDLRQLDESIKSDILIVLAAQRGGGDYPFNMPTVADGESRTEAVVKSWAVPRCIVQD